MKFITPTYQASRKRKDREATYLSVKNDLKQQELLQHSPDMLLQSPINALAIEEQVIRIEKIVKYVKQLHVDKKMEYMLDDVFTEKEDLHVVIQEVRKDIELDITDGLSEEGIVQYWKKKFLRMKELDWVEFVQDCHKEKNKID